MNAESDGDALTKKTLLSLSARIKALESHVAQSSQPSPEPKPTVPECTDPDAPTGDALIELRRKLKAQAVKGLAEYHASQAALHGGKQTDVAVKREERDI